MNRRVIGIGETVLDIIFKNDQPQAAVPGGSTFNAIISLGRSGVPCEMVTETGDDHVGEITCKYLRDNGVSDRYVVRHRGVKSHISLAFLNDQNDANYQFYKDHAGVTLNGRVPDFCGEDQVLYGSFFAINPAIREQVKGMLEAAHHAGAFLYYDVNFRKPHVADLPRIFGNVEENMRLATIVRGSIDDFALLYQREHPSAEEIYECVAPLCDSFICTDGANGIHLFTPRHHLVFPVQKIETVSTIGAGDNFNAGFLYGLRKKNTTDLMQLLETDWAELIASGQQWAQDVCRQLGNSISPKLAESLRKTT